MDEGERVPCPEIGFTSLDAKVQRTALIVAKTNKKRISRCSAPNRYFVNVTDV